MRHRITPDENCDAVAAFERDTLKPMAPSPDLDDGQLKEMYARMRLIREFEQTRHRLGGRLILHHFSSFRIRTNGDANADCVA